MRSMLAEYTAGEAFYGDYLYFRILQLLLILAREHVQLPSHKEIGKAYDKYFGMVETANNIHHATSLKSNDEDMPYCCNVMDALQFLFESASVQPLSRCSHPRV